MKPHEDDYEDEFVRVEFTDGGVHTEFSDLAIIRLQQRGELPNPCTTNDIVRWFVYTMRTAEGSGIQPPDFRKLIDGDR